MTAKRISELAAMTEIASGDLLACVDVSAGVTKKLSLATLFAAVAITGGTLSGVTINATSIGATTPGTIAGTTITATSIAGSGASALTIVAGTGGGNGVVIAGGTTNTSSGGARVSAFAYDAVTVGGNLYLDGDSNAGSVSGSVIVRVGTGLAAVATFSRTATTFSALPVTVTNTTEATSSAGCAVFSGGISAAKGVYAGGLVTAASGIVAKTGTSGQSVFAHSAGFGGITVAGPAAASSALITLGNTYDTSFVEEWRVWLDGSDDSLRFSAGQTPGAASGLDAMILSASGVLTVTNSTDATSSAGSIVTSGGISAAKGGYYGGDVTLSRNTVCSLSLIRTGALGNAATIGRLLAGGDTLAIAADILATTTQAHSAGNAGTGWIFRGTSNASVAIAEWARLANGALLIGATAPVGSEKLRVAGDVNISGKITGPTALPASFADLAAVRTFLATLIA